MTEAAIYPEVWEREGDKALEWLTKDFVSPISIRKLLLRAEPVFRRSFRFNFSTSNSPEGI